MALLNYLYKIAKLHNYAKESNDKDGDGKVFAGDGR